MGHQLVKLLLVSLLVGLSCADYHIAIVLRSIEFLDPPNTLSDGSCCDAGCGDDAACCAAAVCSPTVRFCFRESQHDRDDVESCPILTVVRTNPVLITMGLDNPAIARYYTGGFQVYLRVSHFNRNPSTSNPDFDPPFIDPLIDNVYFEFSTPAALFDDRLTPPFQRVESTGEFGRVRAEVQIGVHCADNWIGSACEMLCDGDSCITVYQAPTTSPPTTPTTGTAPSATSTDESSNVVGIAVGVSLGAVALLVIFTAVIITACCLMKRTRKTSSYTIKPRRPQKSEIRVIPNEEPPTPAIYAVVNKQNKKKSLARSEISASSDVSNGGNRAVPPPPPKYTPDPPHYTASDEYVPMDGGMYANVVHHEIEESL